MGHLPFTGSIARSGIQIVPDRKTVITEKDHRDVTHVKNFTETIVTLNKDGFIKFGTPEVRLYRDGTIEDENGRRLKISKSTKSLRIGFGAQGVNFTDPNEIRISDKPRPFLQFDCFESKNTIKFNLYQNMDVIRAIFKYFVER